MSDNPLWDLDALPTPLARHVDQLCTQFEAAWKAGQHPQIETCLEGTPGPARPVLLRELLLVEIECRRRRGEVLRAAEYQGRFPALDPAWLAEALAAAPLSGSSQPRPATSRGNIPEGGSSTPIPETARTMALDPPRPLGKFLLLEQVGVGAFGAVWRARDTELDRVVALKIPHAGLMRAPQFAQRFQREARAVAQLRHPHIVTVHEIATLDGQPVLVSDFIDGVPLKDLLEARRLTFRETATLVAEVAGALDYAHSLGLVNRDVKPANLMVERHPSGQAMGKALVVDFGLAQREDAESAMTADGQLVGTPTYMSPEQAGSGHPVDRRSDVFSLGVVLYELLGGAPPFHGSKAMVVQQVLYEEPRRPRGLNGRVPPDLETICLKALAKDAGRRYPTARELEDDLRRWLGGEPIRARPVSQAERLWRWGRRNPLAAGLVAALILLLATVEVASAVAAYRFRALAEREHEAAEQAARAKQDAEDQAEQIRQSMVRQDRAYRLLESGQMHMGRGHWRQALAELTEAAELRPDNSFVWAARGGCLAGLRLWDLAAEDYAKSFALHRTNEASQWHDHAALRVYTGDRAGYRQVCERLLDHFGSAMGARTGWWVADACTLAPESGVDPARVVRLAEFSLASEPQSLAYRHTLGAAHYRAGQFAQAVQCLGEVARANPDWVNSETWPLLALAHHQLGQAAEARHWLDKTHRGLEQNLRGIYRNQHDVLKVFNFYREAQAEIAGLPQADHPLRWVLHGWAYSTLGQLDTAAAYFTQAIEHQPRNPNLWLARGNFWAENGQWVKAAADWEQAFAFHPTDEHLDECRYALLRLRVGDAAGYRHQCRRILERFSQPEDTPEGGERLAQVAWTCLLAPDKVADVQVAARLAERPLARDPQNPWFLHTAGVALCRAGRYQEAVPLLHQAVAGTWVNERDREAGTALSRLFLALAHHHLGEAEEARLRLAEAARSIDRAAAPEGKSSFGAQWHFWAACQVVRREVEALGNASIQQVR